MFLRDGVKVRAFWPELGLENLLLLLCQGSCQILFKHVEIHDTSKIFFKDYAYYNTQFKNQNIEFSLQTLCWEWAILNDPVSSSTIESANCVDLKSHIILVVSLLQCLLKYIVLHQSSNCFSKIFAYPTLTKLFYLLKSFTFSKCRPLNTMTILET